MNINNDINIIDSKILESMKQFAENYAKTTDTFSLTKSP
jgi:hypothetical protein